MSEKSTWNKYCELIALNKFWLIYIKTFFTKLFFIKFCYCIFSTYYYIFLQNYYIFLKTKYSEDLEKFSGKRPDRSSLLVKLQAKGK